MDNDDLCFRDGALMRRRRRDGSAEMHSLSLSHTMEKETVAFHAQVKLLSLACFITTPHFPHFFF